MFDVHRKYSGISRTAKVGFFTALFFSPAAAGDLFRMAAACDRRLRV